jgi:GH25 family lysozyme M1 (1,4-beta-N-acetylmuramidase)
MSTTWSGIDVSEWQGIIDWNKVKAAGLQFALIRAGYGNTLSYPNQIDKQYVSNYNKCKAAGLPVGVYFYCYAETVADAQREAQSCLALLKGRRFEYPIYYDVEEIDTFKTGLTNEIIKAFADILEAAGYWVGVYIYRSAAQAYLTDRTRSRYAMAIAEYGPKLNYSGQYGVWQNSSTYRVNGISGNVDHDYCYIDYPSQIKARGKNGYAAQQSSSAQVKPIPAKPAQQKKTVDEIAREVIAGKWGAGAKRKELLTAAGYDYATVQASVEKQLNGIKPKKDIDTIAREVIRGLWGSGIERTKKLTAAGYDAKAVQARVNQLI